MLGVLGWTLYTAFLKKILLINLAYRYQPLATSPSRVIHTTATEWGRA